MSFLSRFLNPSTTRPEVLAVSPDDRFFTSILCAASDTDWKVHWVRSIESAHEELARRPVPVVVYDCHPHLPEWECVIRQLASDELPRSVILAAPVVDEDLWVRALEHGAYDVVPRSAISDHLMATLRFAWKRTRRREETEAPAEEAASGRLGVSPAGRR